MSHEVNKSSQGTKFGNILGRENEVKELASDFFSFFKRLYMR